jgi:hypothetical protein
MALETSKDAMSYVISFSESAHDNQAKIQHEGSDDWKLAKELSISVICIVLGIAMFFMAGKLKTPGLLLVFFGAQTAMNMYMKAVFSSSVVWANPDVGDSPWLGFQASFFVTAMQQVGSFVIFWAVYGPVKLAGRTNYSIKVLESRKEVIAVPCFAASFTCNIALNNFSLMLMPLTLNLIIRSCLPLSTFLAQWILKKMETGEGKPIKPLEIGLMALGVAMAGVCAWAQVSAKAEAEAAEGKDAKGGGETSRILLGIIVCVVSLFAGSANLALAGLLGTSVKLDSAGTVVYNSIPAAVILLPLILTVAHPIKWSGYEGVPKTDFWVASQVWTHSKSTFAFAASSSLASLVYNILQFGIVQYLSATHVAFAGNFNKAATIPLAILVGIDKLPQGKWGPIMIIGAIINIGAFTAYNMVTGGAGGHGGGSSKETEKETEKQKEPMKDAASSDDDSDESSSEGGCC